MTLQEVLAKVDELKANLMSDSTKTGFVNEIEARIHEEVIMKHEHTEEQEVCPEYNDATDPQTVMLAPTRFGMLYVYYVMGKIDMMNREIEEENNNNARFMTEYRNFTDWYTRNHMPLQPADYRL